MSLLDRMFPMYASSVLAFAKLTLGSLKNMDRDQHHSVVTNPVKIYTAFIHLTNAFHCSTRRQKSTNIWKNI